MNKADNSFPPTISDEQALALKDLLDGYHQGRLVCGDFQSEGYVNSLIQRGEAALLAVSGGGAPHVGDSDFESWFAGKNMAHLSTKQLCHDAYAAGMLAVPEQVETAEPSGIDAMVSRFLAWPLPDNFSPDAGISFKPLYNETYPFGPMRHKPTGTNLLSGTQAKAMLEHVLRRTS